MNDVTLEDPADNKKNRLQFRFLTTGALTLALALCLLAIYVSWLLYRALVMTHADALASQTQSVANQLAVNKVASSPVVADQLLAQRLAMSSADKLVLLAAPSGAIVWLESTSSAAVSRLSEEQMKAVAPLLQGRAGHIAQTPELWNPVNWSGLLTGLLDSTDVWVPIKDAQGSLHRLAQFRATKPVLAQRSRNLTYLFLVLVTLCCATLFFVLYTGFQRGIRTIEEQEVALNHQITRLSNLLTINKTMQKNMRTASARAVELNEQFLRRVGADLHDGPAQQIGYSVLRLNQISRLPVANELGHEFAAVREALETSLEEIRGISSGLVLPELEHMTLEQCLRKVVTLHGTKSSAEVAQYYTELPDDIPLPIKITAYRFVQEGLNNADRHGQAKKCRLTAHVSDHVLTVSLKDNGIGFRISKLSTAAEGGHLGLMGLKDRVESLGGKLSINSELGVGTAIKFSIKLADEA